MTGRNETQFAAKKREKKIIFHDRCIKSPEQFDLLKRDYNCKFGEMMVARLM